MEKILIVQKTYFQILGNNNKKMKFFQRTLLQMQPRSHGLSSSRPSGARGGREDERPWERGCYKWCNLVSRVSVPYYAGLMKRATLQSSLTGWMLINFEHNMK